MAMGIVSDDDFDAELTKANSPKPIQAEVIDINRGRGSVNEIPNSLRKIIGEEKLNGATGVELSKIFDVSQSSISAYAHSATSTATYNQPNPELQSHLTSVRKRITKRASRVLNHSLDTITPDSLKEIGPVKAASIARDMSTIIRNMEPEHDDDGAKVQNNVIFYAPRLRDESEFESISVDS